ncbi:MAG: hypothetical protein IJH79_16905, partial [Lentisphaeria bacterium]|nr:hypothetical protein [Lentisphaeria bacterium]
MTPGTPGKSRLRKAVDLGMAVFFVAYLVIGLLLVPNYGLSADDEVQRKHSLVNYKYINKVLLGRDVPGLENVVDLAEYDQYYGVALQMPMVLYEDLNHFSLSKREIYLSRHYCIFVMCVLGMVFFYLALRKVFPESPAVPAFGTLMVALYPRFFGGQFVDVKNRLFAATCMLVLWLPVMAVETKKPVWQIL